MKPEVPMAAGQSSRRVYSHATAVRAKKVADRENVLVMHVIEGKQISPGRMARIGFSTVPILHFGPSHHFSQEKADAS
jgi:hypothetical protein